ncbi:MAG: hypothetical protein ACSHW0_19605 [Thalassotalea sp.]
MKYLFVILTLFSYQALSCEYNLKNPPEGLNSLVNFKHKSELEKKAYIHVIEFFLAKDKKPQEYFSYGFSFNNDKALLTTSLFHYSGFCIEGVAGNPSGKDGRLVYDAKNQKIVSFLLYQ